MLLQRTEDLCGLQPIQLTLHASLYAVCCCAVKGVNPWIEIDGGVGPDNAWKIIEAGANAIVAGSAVFGAKSYKDGESVAHLEASVQGCLFCLQLSNNYPASVLADRTSMHALAIQRSGSNDQRAGCSCCLAVEPCAPADIHGLYQILLLC